MTNTKHVKVKLSEIFDVIAAATFENTIITFYSVSQILNFKIFSFRF